MSIALNPDHVLSMEDSVLDLEGTTVTVVEPIGMGGEAYLLRVVDETATPLVMKIHLRQFDEKADAILREARRRRSRILASLRLDQLAEPAATWLLAAPRKAFRADVEVATPFSTDLVDVEGYLAAFVEGETFARWMAPDHAPPAPADRIEWAEQLCGAIHLFERTGFVHGDLSPGNLVLRPGPSARIHLLDFDGFFVRDIPPLPVTPMNGGRGWGTDGYRSAAFKHRTDDLVVESDRLALAVLVFEIMVREPTDDLPRDTLLEQREIDEGRVSLPPELSERWPAGWRMVERALDATSRHEWQKAASPGEWLAAIAGFDSERRHTIPAPVPSTRALRGESAALARHDVVVVPSASDPPDAEQTFALPRDADALANALSGRMFTTVTHLASLDDESIVTRIREHLEAADVRSTAFRTTNDGTSSALTRIQLLHRKEQS